MDRNNDKRLSGLPVSKDHGNFKAVQTGTGTYSVFGYQILMTIVRHPLV
ncbi:hypothetical protein J7438_09875 [Thalassotalea sp. G20_0]|nr:hypothetical protein [Thalassotalea sp. G20_0]MBO9494390.1 hypothetical protein [Thalassotalea sp. G20_0]